MKKVKNNCIICWAEMNYSLSSWRARLVWKHQSQPTGVVGQTLQLSMERLHKVLWNLSVKTRRSLHLCLGTWDWNYWSCKHWGNASVNVRWGIAIVRFYWKNMRQQYPGFKIMHLFACLQKLLNLLSSWFLQQYHHSWKKKLILGIFTGCHKWCLEALKSSFFCTCLYNNNLKASCLAFAPHIDYFRLNFCVPDNKILQSDPSNTISRGLEWDFFRPNFCYLHVQFLA